MNEEIELKLDLSPASAQALERSSLWPGAGEVAQLDALYFDTPDRLLRAHGLTLRVRRSGDERIQTIKADGASGSGGLFTRAEWEMPVPADEPVLDARAPIAAVLDGAAATIERTFQVEVERRKWLLSNDGATTEIVLDRGRVRAGEREAPVCEVELEQKAGNAAALFALARRIDAVAPVRLGVVTKSERGYHLLDGDRASFKAKPIPIDEDAVAGEAFLRIARACIRHYRLNETLLLDRYDPAALHQARVAIRRLRSAFTLFKPMLAEQDRLRFQQELRWLAGVLGEARDLDVLLDAADAPLRPRIEQARVAAQADVLHALASDRVRAMFIDLAEWLAVGAGLDPDARVEPARDFAARRLGHLFRRVKKGGAHMKKLNDEARHDVRKEAKKLRYAAEFFAALFAGRKKLRQRHARFINALTGLQDDLGALNDLVSMPFILEQHGLADTQASGHDKDRRKLIRKTAKALDRLSDAPRFWR